MNNDRNDRLSAFAYEPDYTYGYAPNINGTPLAPDSVYEPYQPWNEYGRYNYKKQHTIFENDHTYQAWIRKRGAPPDCAALWQEACADFFFLQECDGKCSICKKLIQFKGGLKK